MNKIFLKGIRKSFSIISAVNKDWHSDVLFDEDQVSQLLYDVLSDNKPVMIGRYGAFELMSALTYLSIKKGNHSLIDYIRGKQFNWWWDEKLVYHMENNTGFFPADKEHLMQFGELMIESIKQLNVLGLTEITWSYSNYIKDYLLGVPKVSLWNLEPWFSSEPWSRCLYNKRVVIVHPLADLIERQYNEKRMMLFGIKNILPEFLSIRTVKAVQSLGGKSNGFSDWFEALAWMEHEIDKEDYDIALIGCGAYGFPLAAHCKRMGKKAVHLGGALQLLFGIRGKRWEDPNFGVKKWGIPVGMYSNLMNEYWIRPGDSFKPQNAQQVEGACYW